MLGCVVWCSPHERVELNFGQKPFRFDLDSLVREEQSLQASAIDRCAPTLQNPPLSSSMPVFDTLQCSG